MNYLFLLSYGWLSFCRKKSRLIILLGFVLLWFIFAFNYSNPDYANYEGQYQSGDTLFFTEPVYVFLMRLCKQFGLHFKQFVFIESFIGLFLLVKSITALSPNPGPIIFLYAIFPFYLDVIQTRSFLAEACLLCAIAHIVKYHEQGALKNLAASMAMLVVSVGFHYSAVFYAPVLLLLFYNRKTKRFLQVVIPILYIAAPMLLKILAPFLATVVGGHKVFLWIVTAKTPTLPHIARILAIRMGLLAILLMGRKIEVADSVRTNARTDAKEVVMKQETYNDVLLMAYIYITLNAIFEIFISATYERLSRPGVIVGTILLSRYIERMSNTSNKNIFWIALVIHNLLYLMSGFLFYKYGDMSWFTMVFRAVFENNYLWN